MRNKNVPYVKQYDNNGNCTNPINVSYMSFFPNRKQRSEHLNQIPFKGNGLNYPITVLKESKYLRQVQYIMDAKTQKIKKIHHYLMQ
jgi:hypothetical protein